MKYFYSLNYITTLIASRQTFQGNAITSKILKRANTNVDVVYKGKPG